MGWRRRISRVIIDPTVQALIVLSHDAAGTPWITAASDARETLDLPEIGVAIPLADIYHRVVVDVEQQG